MAGKCRHYGLLGLPSSSILYTAVVATTFQTLLQHLKHYCNNIKVFNFQQQPFGLSDRGTAQTARQRAVQHDAPPRDDRTTSCSYPLFCCVAYRILYSNIFRHLDKSLHASARHGCRQGICITAT